MGRQAARESHGPTGSSGGKQCVGWGTEAQGGTSFSSESFGFLSQGGREVIS